MRWTALRRFRIATAQFHVPAAASQRPERGDNGPPNARCRMREQATVQALQRKSSLFNDAPTVKILKLPSLSKYGIS